MHTFKSFKLVKTNVIVYQTNLFDHEEKNERFFKHSFNTVTKFNAQRRKYS